MTAASGGHCLSQGQSSKAECQQGLSALELYPIPTQEQRYAFSKVIGWPSSLSSPDFSTWSQHFSKCFRPMLSSKKLGCFCGCFQVAGPSCQLQPGAPELALLTSWLCPWLCSWPLPFQGCSLPRKAFSFLAFAKTANFPTGTGLALTFSKAPFLKIEFMAFMGAVVWCYRISKTGLQA